MSEFLVNPFRQNHPAWDSALTAPYQGADPAAFHRTLPGYAPTPLVPRPALAARLGLGALYVKDENYRLGLNAFKILGASYAIYRLLRERWEESNDSPFGETLELTDRQRSFFADLTFCTATDGNHGRAVAWTARRLALPAVIYMPGDTVPARVENIRRENARVEVIDGTYDQAVDRIKTDAARHGWQIISDTAWPGYTGIPGWIQAAYSTLFQEIEPDLLGPERPAVDCVILQGGVGALAAGAAWYFTRRYGPRRPLLVCVEPTDAACLLESARTPDGRPVPASGQLHSLMAGLNCGVPSQTAWPLIRDTVDLFVAIEDHWAAEAMGAYYWSEGGDSPVISGESGAAGLAAVMALVQDPALSEAHRHLDLGPDSRVLVLNTEGATDPEGFRRRVLDRKRGEA